jgi:hypothetical protein
VPERVAIFVVKQSHEIVINTAINTAPKRCRYEYIPVSRAVKA